MNSQQQVEKVCRGATRSHLWAELLMASRVAGEEYQRRRPAPQAHLGGLPLQARSLLTFLAKLLRVGFPDVAGRRSRPQPVVMQAGKGLLAPLQALVSPNSEVESDDGSVHLSCGRLRGVATRL